jgi:calcineurin-like phosphoesterase family protein
MSKLWVWSDPHFGHANIIRFCNRPFANVEEMDQGLIDNHNAVVGPEDTVICNGDFQFYKNDMGIFEKLAGKYKILIKGNHDHKVTRKMSWDAIHDVYEFVHNSKKIVMFHYPIESWNNKFHGSIHLYGHTHSEDMPAIENRYNICVEKTNYQPVNLDAYTK